MTLPEEMIITLLDGCPDLGNIHNLNDFFNICLSTFPIPIGPLQNENFPYKQFGISHQQANLMDRQLLRLLVCCWTQLQRHPWLNQYRHRIGLFVSASPSEYLTTILPAVVQNRPQDLPELFALNDATSYATRLAWYLDIGGPAISTNSGCAGGATAIHLAINSLLAGQCDYAITAASSPGHGALTLLFTTKPLSNGHPVLAELLGSGQSSDGREKVSYGAPGMAAMERAVRDALATSEMDPAEIGLILPSGSDTTLGREIESTVLDKIYGNTPKRLSGHSLWGNIGPASAPANLLLACAHILGNKYGPLFFGINSFGMGGNNLHLVGHIDPQTMSRPQPATIKPLSTDDCEYPYHEKKSENSATDRQQLVEKEFCELLDLPTTAHLENSTLRELGLDSYITMTLITRLEIALGEQLNTAIFSPNNTIGEIRKILLRQSPLSAELKNAVGKYVLTDITYYSKIKNFFENLHPEEKIIFPQPLRHKRQLLTPEILENLWAENKLLLLAILSPDDEIIGFSCYAENSPQLICRGQKFFLGKATLQDFHYLLPNWRNRFLKLPDIGPFLMNSGFDMRLIAGRQRSTGLIVSNEIRLLQTRLLAAATSDNYREEETLYQNFLHGDETARAHFMQLVDNTEWQARYFELIKDNHFGNTDIGELLNIGNNPQELLKLKAIIDPSYLFTLTAARQRVKSGEQVYAGLSFLHFEPLFLGDIV